MSNATCFLPSPPEGEGLGERGKLAKLQRYAKQMRHAPTPWEHELWQTLRALRFAAVKFKRQQPIGPYIVDFIALSKKLVIELDGGQHSERTDYDAKRDEFLKLNGFSVIRVWNNEWAENRAGVLEAIWLALHHPPLPGAHRRQACRASPSGGEGLEP